MEIDYQRKYFELKNQCHKHEATISKLQAEIRERCQSYLLYSSRNKRTNTAEGLDNSQLRMHQSSSNRQSLEESVVKKYQPTQERGVETESLGNGEVASEEVEKMQKLEHKIEHLAISAQFNLNAESAELAKGREEEITDTKQLIIQSYKDRITKINQQKTKYARQAEKVSKQLLQANIKASELERKLETVTKSEKKLKHKLTKMAEFEEKIHKIYEEIYTNLNIKDKAIDREDLDSFSQRIQFILQLISESAEGLNQSHQYSSTSNEERETLSNGHSSSSARHLHSSSKAEHDQSSGYPEGITTLSMAKQNKIHEDFSTPVAAFEEDQTEANAKIKQLNSNLQQQRNEIQQLIDEMKKEHEKQVELLKQEFEKERFNLNAIYEKQVEAHQKYQVTAEDLLQQLQGKDILIIDLQQKLAEAKEACSQSQLRLEQSLGSIQQYKEELKQSRQFELQYQKTKEELDKSRSIIDEMEHLKLTKEHSGLKDSSVLSTKDKRKDSLAESQMKVVENLQQPYYVEQDLTCDPNDEYVKRSFIRKKIVRRNFSASAYRVQSKSKEEVDSIIRSTLHQCTDRSLEKKEQLKQRLKIEKESRKNKNENPRISQVSEQNRESGYREQEVVRVLQVETITPKEVINTRKIYSQQGQEVFCLRKKQR